MVIRRLRPVVALVTIFAFVEEYVRAVTVVKAANMHHLLAALTAFFWHARLLHEVSPLALNGNY